MSSFGLAKSPKSDAERRLTNPRRGLVFLASDEVVEGARVSLSVGAQAATSGGPKLERDGNGFSKSPAQSREPELLTVRRRQARHLAMTLAPNAMLSAIRIERDDGRPTRQVASTDKTTAAAPRTISTSAAR